MSAANPESLLEQFFYVTVRMEAQLPDGGVSVGTGFIYEVPTGGGQSSYFVVTNKHVIADAQSLMIYFIGKNAGGGPALGNARSVEIADFSTRPDLYSYGHPDPDIDVAVLPLLPLLKATPGGADSYYFKAISSDAVPTLAALDELDAVEDVRFVGYPDGIYDTENFLPVMRRGTTASYLQHDYEGKPTFLIDASVFGGSSGSPVFIADRGSYSTKHGMVVGERMLLLGVVAAVRQTQRFGHLVATPTSTITPVVHEMLDLGIVYKARTIDECVDAILSKHGLTRADASAAAEPTAAEASALSAAAG